MKTITFLAGILGALLFIIASILGGLQIDGYSFMSQYISESYASGLPNTQYLRYMFIASGLLLALFGVLTPFVLPKSKALKVGFFLFAIFYGLGTVATGIFPCDIGCSQDPEMASLSQLVHNTVGFFTYALVPFCLVGIGFLSKKNMNAADFSKTAILCGILAFCFVALLFGNSTGSFIGLFQRIIEGSILFWVMYTAFFIRRTVNN